MNVHAFEGRVRGPGGFPNISAKTRRINFVGTLTAKGLELEIDGGVRIVSEGAMPKFVPEVREISFNGRLARERGQQVRYITERAVFALERRRPRPDRGRARHRRRARRDRPDGLPAPRGGRPAAHGRAASTRPARWAWRRPSGGMAADERGMFASSWAPSLG